MFNQLKMSEKLCLQWNDFQENIRNAFGSLREDNDFADVTLACEDGQQVEAHKVILAASSPFFRKLLGRNKHSHPLIYMRGMKSEDLLAMVDFLYRGEANVFQENLDSFLAIAEELQLKGLMGKTIENEQEKDEMAVPPAFLHAFNTGAKIPKTSSKRQTSSSKIPTAEENKTLAIPGNFSGDLDELEEKVKSMMEKSRNNLPYRNEKANMCKVCGKEGQSGSIKDHIEANHLEGIIIPCNLCDKTFRSSNSYKQHKRKHQQNGFKKLPSLRQNVSKFTPFQNAHCLETI